MIEIDHIRAAGAEMFVLVSLWSHENLVVKFQNCGSCDSVNCFAGAHETARWSHSVVGGSSVRMGIRHGENTAHGHPIFLVFLCKMMRANCDVSSFSFA